MRQTTLCVPLDVKPESCSRLSALVESLRRREDRPDGYPENFGRLAQAIPTLHFMSMSVFPATEFDPIFIIEANFDGAPGVFWGQFEAAIGAECLRDILRCCKRPLNEDGPLHDGVTAPDSRAPVAPYLEARTEPPSVFHHGNRGLTRDRILDEAKLFLDVRQEIDDPTRAGPSPYRGVGAAAAHGMLRARMLERHAWLRQVAPERITGPERATDMLKLLFFAALVLFALSLPGILLAPFLTGLQYIVVIVLVALLIGVVLYRKRAPLPGTGTNTSFGLLPILLRQAWLIAACVAAYVFLSSIVLTPVVLLLSHLFALARLGDALEPISTFWTVAREVALGLLSLVVVLPLVVLWLRYLERRDSWHDAPHVDERLLREMVRREDWIAQNHMGSIVLIKPGVLRTAVIRAGHLGLGLVLRVVATDGYLGSMRTVHFAHWAFLNNRSRLLFFSNFDHSWDSYLDDFIEKAHGGLTLAWGCGVGFPPTRFLVLDGASHGRLFKTWALASRAVSRFWYSAYPTLTVDQVERNNRIADGLRKPSLTEGEAVKWMEDL